MIPFLKKYPKYQLCEEQRACLRTPQFPTTKGVHTEAGQQLI